MQIITLQIITEGHGTRINNLETDKTTNKSDIQTLETASTNHGTSIMYLQSHKQDKLNDISDNEILAISTYTQEGQQPIQIATTKGDFKDFKLKISVLENDTTTIELKKIHMQKKTFIIHQYQYLMLF